MSLNLSNINEPHLWNSSITSLSSNPKKPTQSIEKLLNAGIKTLYDLIWILPLRVQNAPKLSSFESIEVDELILGKGEILAINSTPAFGRRARGKMQLFNITVDLQDSLSDELLTLRFFNAYPNMVKILKPNNHITFMGKLTDYKGKLQVVNPNLNPKDISDEFGLLVQYPTVAGVATTYLKKLIRKIPKDVWESPLYSFKSKTPMQYDLNSINDSFKILHGLKPSIKADREEALNRLIYLEFFEDQIKVIARRQSVKALDASIYDCHPTQDKELQSLFPYDLTDDQEKVWGEIKCDLKSGHPMMRMVQGDVGCGKTSLAIMASALIASRGAQVALMCPTESLARQHYLSFKESLGDDFNLEIIVGSTKQKEKNIINKKLKDGAIKIIIGTHSLIQDSIEFSNLSLAIIDEQHKFGVEQRLKLLKKGRATHCMIMSATPIPRTLQLAQFGDLDISTIKTMPSGRKGIKTRIVEKSNYEKYLSFLKTRISLGEQAYIVAPAIEESETLNIKNVNEIINSYKKIFPELRIDTLHGKLKADHKNEVLNRFKDGEVDILISTSVIEVGINVLNATVMSIYNPDRFGLSSLHQLRGRVGRGKSAGFCFLITKDGISQEAKERLTVLEKSNDGFLIADADLKNRGEGDLFGVNQSGTTNVKKVASVFTHFDVFNNVTKDLKLLQDSDDQQLQLLVNNLMGDKKISATI